MKPVLIENSQSLDEICDQLCKEPLLAVDTEFFRETTYFPHIGLVQIASPDQVICIDPLAFDARSGLSRLLLDTSITKIFHACTQDMEVLYQYLGELPSPVIDTQIAAALFGLDEQVGYANLVEEIMGIQLEKSQTRTNWLKRPLTSKQIEYAGDDVLYLIPVYNKLVSELKNKNRESWLLEDCTRISNDHSRFFPDMNNCWRRIRGINKLNGIQLCIAQAIAEWREQYAMKKDMTRRRAIPDDIVIQIATSPPANLTELKGITFLSKRLSNEELVSLEAAICKSTKTPESEWPSINRHRPTPEEKKQLNDIQDLLNEKSADLGIAQSMLCSRKDIEKLIQGDRDIQIMQGWRFDCIGKKLLEQVP